jgi:hypothetical protein
LKNINRLNTDGNADPNDQKDFEDQENPNNQADSKSFNNNESLPFGKTKGTKNSIGFKFLNYLKASYGLFIESLNTLYCQLSLNQLITYGMIFVFLYIAFCYFCHKLFGDDRKRYYSNTSFQKLSLFLILNLLINLVFYLYCMNHPETSLDFLILPFPIVVLLLLFFLWFLCIYLLVFVFKKKK